MADVGNLKICLCPPEEEFGLAINSFVLCSIGLFPPSVATPEPRRVCLGEEGWKEIFTFHPGSDLSSPTRAGGGGYVRAIVEWIIAFYGEGCWRTMLKAQVDLRRGEPQ